jgi:hypothetical protein
MILEGSRQWQSYIFLGAALYLLYQIWSGWRLGVVRGLMRFAVLICAWSGAKAAAGATGTLHPYFSQLPPLLVPGAAALSAGFTIFVILSILSALLFKRTKHHEGITHIIFGLGGAFCGAVFGLILLWGSISLIRGLGALGELRIAQTMRMGQAPSTEKTALFLMRLKSSLEIGTWGKLLCEADPIPSRYYENSRKGAMILENQQAFERFFHYPGILKITYNPKVTALLQEPVLSKALQKGEVIPLLHDRLFQEITNDPKMQILFKNFDLTAAFNFALAEPPPSS